MLSRIWPHGLQHARPSCPSSSPGVHPNPCPLSWWCHPLLSPSPPALNLSQHQGIFKWVSSLHQVAKVLEFQLMNTQDWFPLGWTGWIFLQSKGLSRVFSNTTVQKHQFYVWQKPLQYYKVISLQLIKIHEKKRNKQTKKASILRHSAFFIVQLSHPYMNSMKSFLVKLVELTNCSFSHPSNIGDLEIWIQVV